MERNKRRQLTGTVVSAKSDKTIGVLVERYRRHRLYGKQVRVSKKYQVHDENNLANEGDIVRIRECRPISKKKRFVLVKVISEAVEI
ncbi:MAG: 30S ribosomal protein S17 [Acholeplasmataceae bacterium]|jgi:small subunit ribosomal protein S17|nr:30S ribosomal protein S17 [Acholeplasmataceae bacterium]